jgi:hypothetical protein
MKAANARPVAPIRREPLGLVEFNRHALNGRQRSKV